MLIIFSEKEKFIFNNLIDINLSQLKNDNTLVSIYCGNKKLTAEYLGTDLLENSYLFENDMQSKIDLRNYQMVEFVELE